MSNTALAICQDETKLIWSLYQLLQYNAGLFMTAIFDLDMVIMDVLTDYDEKELRGRTSRILGELRRECEVANLQSCKDQICRIEQRFMNSPIHSLIMLISDLRGHIQDELLKRNFFLIDPSEQRYYDASFIRSEIKDKFPSCISDLSEAGKCLVFRRNTAAVCHCMRALEVGLDCLAKDLKLTPKNPNWENIINDCQEAIRNLPNKIPRMDTWKEDQQFYSQCATEFRFFKDAWRNHVMHRRIEYEFGQSLDILNSACRYFVYLSERLSEPT